MSWKLADAKNRLSEVVRRALTEGPQRISRRDDAVVVMAERDYESLRGEPLTFERFLLERTPRGADLDITRDPGEGRPVDL